MDAALNKTSQRGVPVFPRAGPDTPAQTPRDGAAPSEREGGGQRIQMLIALETPHIKGVRRWFPVAVAVATHPSGFPNLQPLRMFGTLQNGRERSKDTIRPPSLRLPVPPPPPLMSSTPVSANTGGPDIDKVISSGTRTNNSQQDDDGVKIQITGEEKRERRPLVGCSASLT